MASAWGESWGLAWGDSWGAVSAQPQPEPEPQQPSVDRPWGQPQPFVIVGTVHVVLPEIIGSALGYHARVGKFAVQLGRLSGRAEGWVGRSGAIEVELGLLGGAGGYVDAEAKFDVKLSIVPFVQGRIGRIGHAVVDLHCLQGGISGAHDPDEPAIMAFLRAA